MDEGFAFRDYLDVVQRRWRVIALVMVVTLAVASGMTLVVPPAYRASATVTADTSPPVILSEQPGGGSLFAGVTLEAPPDAPALAEVARSETVRDGAVARLAPLLRPKQAKALLRGMRVQPIRNTQLVRLTAEHTDPAVAAAMANAVAETLVDLTLKARRQRATQTREFIERQLAQADQQLRAKEMALTASKNRYGSVSLPEETTQNLQQLAQLTTHRIDLQSQRGELQSRWARIRAALSSQNRLSPTQWTPSPLIAQLRNQLVDLEIQRVAQRRVFTPNHQVMIELQARIEETKRRLEAELTKDLQPQQYAVDPVYQQLTVQLRDAEVALAGVEARERAISRVIQDYEQRVQALPAREAELVRLIRNVRGAEAIYLLLSERLEEARIVEASISSGVRVVDAARAPELPARPRRGFSIIIGLLTGLMLSLVAVTVTEHVDETVRSVDDAERVLGAPVLASTPLWRGPRMDRAKTELPLIVMNGHLSPLADSFRLLRTRLLAMSRERPLRTLLITSPGPGEGKDFVAANLAIAFTQTGRRVWLVEGDLRRPVLARAFDPPSSSVGLADLLRDGASVQQALVTTAVENLWLLPCGAPPPNPTELIGSQAMRVLLEQACRDGAELLIIDTPPVLPVPDALTLVPEVDGVLLVIRIGTTPREAARRARERLLAMGARLLGVVVNGAPPGRRDGYYHGDARNGDADHRRPEAVAAMLDGGR